MRSFVTMAWMISVWIFVIVMCVTSVHARTVKRGVSNHTSKQEWVFIPIQVNVSNPNETWIPIPYEVFMESNVTELQQHFQIISLHYNGVLSNETLYPPYEGKAPHKSLHPLLFMVVLTPVLVLVLSGMVFAIVKLMQNRQRGNSHLFHHG